MMQANKPDISSFSCIVDESVFPGLRLDRYVSENLKLLSRSQIKARKLTAKINGMKVKLSRLLKGGEELELSWTNAEEIKLIPQNIPLRVIYEDDRVIVINKTQGMVVHPGAGNWQGTLANALLYRKIKSEKFSEIDIESFATRGIRPGIVHRLDKDTSGLIIAAWDDEAHAFLSEQFKSRRVQKTYAAIVHGCPMNEKGTIDNNIGRSDFNRKIFSVNAKGKRSITHYRLIKRYDNYSLILLRPKTGRTHQLRVHMKYLGIPIVGDPLYGGMDKLFPNAGLMLHSKKLRIRLPGALQPVSFNSLLPARFKQIIQSK